MALKSIQLCHIDPVNRATSKFEVTVHNDEGDVLAIFSCGSEHDAIKLRNATQHAERLRRVADYRDSNAKAPRSVA